MQVGAEQDIIPPERPIEGHAARPSLSVKAVVWFGMNTQHEDMSMDKSKGIAKSAIVALAFSLAASFTGCKSKAPVVDDSALAAQVQARIAGDQNLGGQNIQSSVSNGVVTLNGTVSDDTARSLAGSDAAQVSGIRTVVNNLVVPAPAAAATVAAEPPAPVRPEKIAKPTPVISNRAAVPAAPIVRSNQPPAPIQQAPAPVAHTQAPPPPPPAPVVRTITLPVGTDLPVRITQTLDSASTQTGDKFTGVVASDIIVDGMVVLPQGTPVTGHVDSAHDATHFKGSSLLSISLTSISRKGDRIAVSTEPYTKEGQGRGKNTAEKVGGGAAVGAILGGIFGGGKGAAIGAAAGGGLGAGANTITKGQQVQIPSESIVRFKLADAVMLHVTSSPNGSQSAPGLERRNQ